MPYYALDLSRVDLIDLYKAVSAMQMVLDGAMEDARHREGAKAGPLLGRLNELVDTIARWRDSIVTEMRREEEPSRFAAIQRLRLDLLDCGACPETSAEIVDRFIEKWPSEQGRLRGFHFLRSSRRKSGSRPTSRDA